MGAFSRPANPISLSSPDQLEASFKNHILIPGSTAKDIRSTVLYVKCSVESCLDRILPEVPFPGRN
jgi:hypothetical protein